MTKRIARNVLTKARQLLVENGWLRRGPGPLEKRSCAHIAITRALRDRPGEGELIDHFAKVICKAQKNKSYTAIWKWNDAPKQTKANVLRAFTRAIELVETEF